MMTDRATLDERASFVEHGPHDQPVEHGRQRRDIGAWLRDRTTPQVVLVAAVVLWTTYFTQRSLDIHHGLGTSSYDSGLYDQGMWLLSRGEAPFVTLMGRNLFGDHTSFVLLLLVPFYWVAPGAWIMFFAQSAAIGAGAIPVFLYGRKRLGSEWLAVVCAGTYLLHPAVGWTNLENFHPDAFLGVFVGFAIYAALEAKWKLYLLFVVLSLSVKEDVSLVIVPLGIWVALRRDRRIGLLTIVGSISFMFTAMFVVMRGLIGVPTRNTWRLPFSRAGDSTFRGAARLVDTAVTNPTQLVEHLQAENRPWYIWQMTSPFAWLFLRLPSVALISALVLFTNVLSTFWYQFQVEYHYGLVAVPALAIGTVHAIGAMHTRVGLFGGREPLGGDADAPESDAEPDVGELIDQLVEGELVDGEFDDAELVDGELVDGEFDDAEPDDGEFVGETDADIRPMWVSMRKVAVSAVAVTSFVTATMWSPMPWGRTDLYYGDRDNVYAASMRELIAEIPDDARISVHHRVAPHVVHRVEVYQFPNPFRVVLYGPDATGEGARLYQRADRIEYVMLPTSEDENVAIDFAVIESAYVEVAANQFWVLYERDRTLALPGNDPNAGAEPPSS